MLRENNNSPGDVIHEYFPYKRYAYVNRYIFFWPPRTSLSNVNQLAAFYTNNKHPLVWIKEQFKEYLKYKYPKTLSRQITKLDTSSEKLGMIQIAIVINPHQSQSLATRSRAERVVYGG